MRCVFKEFLSDKTSSYQRLLILFIEFNMICVELPLKIYQITVEEIETTDILFIAFYPIRKDSKMNKTRSTMKKYETSLKKPAQQNENIVKSCQAGKTVKHSNAKGVQEDIKQNKIDRKREKLVK